MKYDLECVRGSINAYAYGSVLDAAFASEIKSIRDPARGSVWIFMKHYVFISVERSTRNAVSASIRDSIDEI